MGRILRPVIGVIRDPGSLIGVDLVALQPLFNRGLAIDLVDVRLIGNAKEIDEEIDDDRRAIDLLTLLPEPHLADAVIGFWIQPEVSGGLSQRRQTLKA